uniref:NID domain-containing protein n=1 Tax=Bubo bubo TaxID=30461 RepID=A0A8C0E9H3_BUBBB
MLPTLPEKKMVFKGVVTNKEDINKLMLIPLIRYPLPGGSALITFEKAEGKSEKSAATAGCPGWAALGPALHPLPAGLGIQLTRSSRSIVVSDLPGLGMPQEALLDKLELFFSKTKNGGGEVESREFLDNTGQVVLTFAQDGGACGVLGSGCWRRGGMAVSRELMEWGLWGAGKAA